MGSDSPLISIVCPVFCHTEDHVGYLSEALESVAAQTYDRTELVIVDDRSPIDIVPIVESVRGLPPTRILRNTANLGHAEARNVGVQASEGELIAFLDHDDIWLPDKLKAQAEVLGSNKDAAMTFCDVEILCETNQNTTAGNTLAPAVSKLYFDQSKIPERPTLGWLMSHRNCVITVSSVLVRKQAMLDIGLFDGRYSSCDDYDAWLKIRSRWPIIHLPKVCAKYRLHRFNANYAVDHLRDNRLLTKLMLDLWKQLTPAEKLQVLPTLVRKTVGRIYWVIRRW
ncbi:MAG: glycosyltransferase [Armatimonadota bacterium]|nr:glycosyltransferase [Armatimonadota bacterium]